LLWEPRNPVPLGTTFCNGVECMSGFLVFQGVVQDATIMKQNEYFGDNPSMPTEMEIPAHASAVLHQIEGVNVVEGGWVGGDAWFGSIITDLEAKKSLKVDLAWIIKVYHAFFLLGVYHAVLKARFGMKSMGHWVTMMMMMISGIKMMAMAYAWSQKGISYFLSKCGSTAVESPHTQT
jgi:hypothetical protein